MNVNLDLSIIFGLIGVLSVAWKIGQDMKKASNLQEVRHTEIMGEIKHINATVLEMKNSHQTIDKVVDDMRLELVEVKASVKSAHKRIDRLEGKRSPPQIEEEEEEPP